MGLIETATIFSTTNCFRFTANLPFGLREIRQKTNINHGPFSWRRLNRTGRYPSSLTEKESRKTIVRSFSTLFGARQRPRRGPVLVSPSRRNKLEGPQLGGRRLGRRCYVQAVVSKTRNILIGVPTWRHSNWRRQNLQRNFNNISVRIFGLTGAPMVSMIYRLHFQSV